MEQSGAWDQTCTYISQLNTETFLFNYWSYQVSFQVYVHMDLDIYIDHVCVFFIRLDPQ